MSPCGGQGICRRLAVLIFVYISICVADAFTWREPPRNKPQPSGPQTLPVEVISIQTLRSPAASYSQIGPWTQSNSAHHAHRVALVTLKFPEAATLVSYEEDSQPPSSGDLGAQRWRMVRRRLNDVKSTKQLYGLVELKCPSGEATRTITSLPPDKANRHRHMPHNENYERADGLLHGDDRCAWQRQQRLRHTELEQLRMERRSESRARGTASNSFFQRILDRESPSFAWQRPYGGISWHSQREVGDYLMPLLPGTTEASQLRQVELLLTKSLSNHSHGWIREEDLEHHYLQRAGNELTFALVLSTVSEAGRRVLLEEKALNRCSLHAVAPKRQALWPRSWLESGHEMDYPFPLSFSLKLHLASPNPLSRLQEVRTVVNLRQFEPLAKNPTKDVDSLWDTNTSINDVALLDVYAHDRAAAGGPPPPVNALLKPVINMMLTPLIGVVNTMIGHDINNQIAATVAPAVDTGSVEEIATIVSPPVARNVSNLATDAVTYYATRKTSFLVIEQIAPPIITSVVEAVFPTIRDKLDELLEPAIEYRLDENLPQILSRSVPILATHKISHAVSHAITASLTHSLQDLRPVQYFCSSCEADQTYCDYCKLSNKNYYSSYYSTYYTDHYAKYFTDYYVRAMAKVDAAVNGGHGDEDW